MSLLIGRNYVSIREEEHNGETVWAETSVGRALLRSTPARVTRSDAGWCLDWKDPSEGEHTITSRATDMAGQIQPAMDDPWITRKHTYWESNGQVTRRVGIA